MKNIGKYLCAAGAVLLLFAGYRQSQAGVERWKFAVVCDSRGADNGVNGEITRELAAAIRVERPEFVLFPGDLVDGSTEYAVLKGQLENWRALFMEPLGDDGIEVYPVRGNHDLGGEQGLQAWNEVFSGRYALPSGGPGGETNLTYSFSFRNAFFAGFDVYVSSREHRVNQAWLEERFLANSLPLVFVFAHEPAYSLSGPSAHGDGLASFPPERDAFVRAFLDEGGTAYFCGHDHWYDHAAATAADGRRFQQYIIGTGGAPLRAWGGGYAESGVEGLGHAETYGYAVVEVDGERATVTFKGREGPGIYRAQDTYGLEGAVSAKLRVFPNPFLPRDHPAGVTIAGAYPGAAVRLYTLSGEPVRELEDADGDGRVSWDGRNGSGENAASGVYLGVSSGGGAVRRGKIALVR